MKLLQQIQTADEWFWSTQHREFVDIPLWEHYIHACMKSLTDYVQFLDRIEAYQVLSRYPPICPWTFEPPGVIYYAQVYSHETYKQLVTDGLRQAQDEEMSFHDHGLTRIKIQTPEICYEACKRNMWNLKYVKEPTIELYHQIFNSNASLYWASLFGHWEVVKALINNGAGFDDNILRAATARRNLELVQWLLDHGADVHANENIALRHASEYGYLEIVQCLIKHGANVHAVDDDSLKKASSKGHLEIVEYLLAHDANVNAFFSGPLRYASSSGHLAVVKCLLAHGADVNVGFAYYAIELASEYGYLDIVKCLLDHGADLHINNDSPLQLAVQNGHSDIVKCLLDHGATALRLI